jgi:lysine 2,3-aminomutase
VLSDKRYAYYDPIDTLPESGRKWWAKEAARQSAP